MPEPPGIRLIWLDRLSLDPAKHRASVTKQIAEYLATLAKSLEESGHGHEPPRFSLRESALIARKCCSPRVPCNKT